MTYSNATPAEVRALIRAGKLTAPTTGYCDGYAQGNLVVLPKALAWDFLLFCPVSYTHLDVYKRQMLAVGRALMGKPKMILMDEPSMGLSPLLVKEIFEIIKEVNKQGITILLVEQNAKMALAISDRAYVLETGTITIEGDAQQLLNDPRVKKAYLGQ